MPACLSGLTTGHASTANKSEDMVSLHVRGCRPELLIREAFLAVPVGVTRLQALFPGADIPRVVERQPYLLLPNCEELLDELLQ